MKPALDTVDGRGARGRPASHHGRHDSAAVGIERTTTAVSSLAELTGPAEDYLKAIYHIAHDGEAAGTNDIARRVGVSPAAVSSMLRRLAEQGLVSHRRYHGVVLTQAGRRAALRTIRRHRVLEAYLAWALDYPVARVHDEAERLEHDASDQLIDRMAAALGDPAVDPHGAPIPTRGGIYGDGGSELIAGTIGNGVP